MAFSLLACIPWQEAERSATGCVGFGLDWKRERAYP